MYPFKLKFSSFLDICPGVGLVNHMVTVILVFWGTFIQFSIGEGNGIPLRYSCLENPMDGEAWWAVVHGVANSRTQLSDFTFTVHFHALEKEMATHSIVLAWRIPETEEPGGLPSMGSHRVRHDWGDLAAAYSFPQWLPIYTSTNSIGGFLFLHTLSSIYHL